MYQKQLSIILFLLAFSLVFAGSVFSTTVFGPKDLNVSKLHYHYSYHTFAVDTAGKGKLTITKTTLDKKIKGGVIFYNRQMIPLRKFFRGDQETLTREIRLGSKNRIFVFLRGKPGAAISLEISEKGIAKPPEAQLSAEPESILQGKSSSLTWATSHADTVTLEPEIGAIDPTGTLSVSPNETTVYTLTAKGAGGTASAQAEVQVTLPPPPPTVTITAEPDTIAPGTPSTLTWNSEFATICTIEPGIGDVAISGSTEVEPKETTTYTITATGLGGTTQAQALVQLYPVKIQGINKPQAHYTTPENTKASSTSALLQHDLDWYYETLTLEAATYHKQLFADAGIDQNHLFGLADANDEEYILDRKPYKDGIMIIIEKRANDIDGTIITASAVLVLEDNLWKATFKYSGDEELSQYDDIQYTDCIANYSFYPDIRDDVCWHGNDLINHNETKLAYDQRNREEHTVVEFNGTDNGFSRQQLNDMPKEAISMGGWIKADRNDHNARIIEIGRDQTDSTAITMDSGQGFRYWIHVDGQRVERSAAMDYDYHDNQWHHVYLTYNGSSMKLYVDSELKDSHAVSGSIDSTATLNIGQHNSAVYGGTSKAFKGKLDDLQIYNKSLTGAEIVEKYNNN